jgi:hypothetical protein
MYIAVLPQKCMMCICVCVRARVFMYVNMHVCMHMGVGVHACMFLPNSNHETGSCGRGESRQTHKDG